MTLGFAVLRWTPRDFWSATPRELAAAAEGLGSARQEPAGRTDLQRLMRAFPDA